VINLVVQTLIFC